MTEQRDINDAWQIRFQNVVWKFGEDIAALHHSNPWPDQPLLFQAINHLATELWDKGFTQAEIRDAFEAAVADMPGYATGDERRP